MVMQLPLVSFLSLEAAEALIHENRKHQGFEISVNARTNDMESLWESTFDITAENVFLIELILTANYMLNSMQPRRNQPYRDGVKFQDDIKSVSPRVALQARQLMVNLSSWL